MQGIFSTKTDEKKILNRFSCQVTCSEIVVFDCVDLQLFKKGSFARFNTIKKYIINGKKNNCNFSP